MLYLDFSYTIGTIGTLSGLFFVTLILKQKCPLAFRVVTAKLIAANSSPANQNHPTRRPFCQPEGLFIGELSSFSFLKHKSSLWFRVVLTKLTADVLSNVCFLPPSVSFKD